MMIFFCLVTSAMVSGRPVVPQHLSTELLLSQVVRRCLQQDQYAVLEIS